MHKNVKKQRVEQLLSIRDTIEAYVRVPHSGAPPEADMQMMSTEHVTCSAYRYLRAILGHNTAAIYSWEPHGHCVVAVLCARVDARLSITTTHVHVHVPWVYMLGLHK